MCIFGNFDQLTKFDSISVSLYFAMSWTIFKLALLLFRTLWSTDLYEGEYVYVIWILEADWWKDLLVLHILAVLEQNFIILLSSSYHKLKLENDVSCTGILPSMYGSQDDKNQLFLWFLFKIYFPKMFTSKIDRHWRQVALSRTNVMKSSNKIDHCEWLRQFHAKDIRVNGQITSST